MAAARPFEKIPGDASAPFTIGVLSLVETSIAGDKRVWKQEKFMGSAMNENLSHRHLEGMDKSLSATAPFDSARKGTYPHPSTIPESDRKEKK